MGESFVEGSGWKCDGKNFCDGNCKASKWMIGGGTCLAGAGSVMILQGLGNGIVDFSNADIVAGSSEVGPFGNWVFLGLFVIVAFTLILGWCCHKSSYNNANYFFGAAVTVLVISTSAVVGTVFPFVNGESIPEKAIAGNVAGLIISGLVFGLCCAIIIGMIFNKDYKIPCLH